jgi:hypothetical protein
MRSHILNDKRIIIINVYHNILFNRNPSYTLLSFTFFLFFIIIILIFYCSFSRCFLEIFFKLNYNEKNVRVVG